MPNGDSKAGEAFDMAWAAVSNGHPSEARDELGGVKTEDLVRLHRYARMTNGVIESLLIERLGAAAVAMLLAAKG